MTVEPDWDEIYKATGSAVERACQVVADVDEGQLFALLLVIGCRLGVVFREDLEAQIILLDKKTPVEQRRTDLRLYHRLLARVANKLRREAEGAPCSCKQNPLNGDEP